MNSARELAKPEVKGERECGEEAEYKEGEENPYSRSKSETQEDDKDGKKRQDQHTPRPGHTSDELKATICCCSIAFLAVNTWVITAVATLANTLCGCVGRVSARIVWEVEECCERCGRMVATYPGRVVAVAVVLVSVASLGLLNLQLETRPYRLWIPASSHFTQVNKWKMKNFPSQHRSQVVLWEAQDNILTAQAVQDMWHLHQRLVNLTLPVGDVNITWGDVCARVPSLLADTASSNHDPLSADLTHTQGGIHYDTWLETHYQTPGDNRTTKQESWRQAHHEAREGRRVLPPSREERRIRARVSQEVWEAAKDDYSHLLARPAYCSLLAALPNLCYERSLLEVWGYQQHLIMNLTDQQVLGDVNEVSTSHVYGYPLQVTQLLGGVVRNRSGYIVAAKSALHTWVTKIQTNTSNSVVDLGTGQLVDQEGMTWEVALLHQVRMAHTATHLKLHVHAAHSFGEVSSSAIVDDVKWVLVGWAAMVFYVVATLEHPLPSLLGLVCVALAVATSCGVCSALGVPYGPITSVLPVLLVGLGVDDMYVMAGAWEMAGRYSVTAGGRGGQTLRKAGVPITLTSLTNVVAFLVGSSTQVPALRWFCYYAAAGIAAVYFLQATVFLAALATDQYCRCPTITLGSTALPSNQNNSGVVKQAIRRYSSVVRQAMKRYSSVVRWAMRRYSNVVVQPSVVVAVVVVAVVLAIVGVWGTVNLHQEFSPVWFLPRSSYLYQWFVAMDEQFPNVGESGSVYFANVNLPEDLPGLHALASALRHSPYVATVDAWFSELDVYMYYDSRFFGRNLTSELLQEALAIFLHSSIGARFTNHFMFKGSLECEGPAPPFSVFKLEFWYRRLPARWQQQAAMGEVRQVVDAANVSGYHAAWAHVYSQWETDASLEGELWRNLGVVVVVVGIMTLVVVGSGLAALLVVGCVLATLLEVAALMHLWGLTIDTVTAIALVLAVGLCVDYSAHVAHAFLVSEGDKRARAQAAVVGVGPAVLHAGLSTLLAFLAILPSHSHLFIAFSKIFIGVSVLGLFQGLVVLPVLLSLVGPHPRPSPTLPTLPFMTQPTLSHQPHIHTPHPNHNCSSVVGHHVVTICDTDGRHVHNPLIEQSNLSNSEKVHKTIKTEQQTLKALENAFTHPHTDQHNLHTSGSGHSTPHTEEDNVNTRENNYSNLPNLNKSDSFLTVPHTQDNNLNTPENYNKNKHHRKGHMTEL